MNFEFDVTSWQNDEKLFNKEWLETNALGTYASSSLAFCNTRKYHGLFVVNLLSPPGRHVLLSTLEESIFIDGQEKFLSCRKHPNLYFPNGHKQLQSIRIGKWPTFTYNFGDIVITRELMLIPGKNLLLMRYQLKQNLETAHPITLRLKPLLAFRNFHKLTYANGDLQAETSTVPNGFKIQPYQNMPALYVQVKGEYNFLPEPDWYYDVEYSKEEARGFAFKEDLFKPGMFETTLKPNTPLFLAVGLEEFEQTFSNPALDMEEVWTNEAQSRKPEKSENPQETLKAIKEHLAQESAKFIVNQPTGYTEVLAGYHWFDAWGRDTLIALPGLTFCAGRPELGIEILSKIGAFSKNGLIPNCFAADGISHAYNSVDASLWYPWTVQQMLRFVPGSLSIAKERCWPVIKSIIEAYSEGKAPEVSMDEAGFLHVGSPSTQLTWMDANVNGKPVTPRHGCPVEITALWYNLLAFANELAESFGEPLPTKPAFLKAMQLEFKLRFWVNSTSGDYLADVWKESGADINLRPNQIFAVAMPHSILNKKDWKAVVHRVKKELLTPYGLRTLAPKEQDYRPVYSGGSEQRDSSYHQGTVWPWLLGAYTESLLRASENLEEDAKALLTTLTPLFTEHLADAGVGSISEIFSATPPHQPDGCIAQAWSVAECLRLICLIQEAAPKAYKVWLNLAHPGGK